MGMERPKLPKNVETAILMKSARRCALCFYLYGDLSVKRGQIAHLDHNKRNNKEDNLAFMCFDHHDPYDGKTSQSKNFTLAEAKKAQDGLYAAIAAKEHHIRANSARVKVRTKPKLNIVYDVNQCIWSVGGQLQKDGSFKRVMSVHFWAVITNDSDEALVILESYPEGTKPQLGGVQPVIPPRRPMRQMMFALVLPVTGTPGQPLETRWVLKDQYGRNYYTPRTTFRWVSSGIEKLP